MTDRRKYLTMAMIAALIVPLGAWAALGPRYGGTLTIGVLDLPLSFDPSPSQGAGARLVLGLTHETLMRSGADGSLQPGLATQWDSSATGKEWTIDLQRSMRFHDGTPLTAADAVRSLRRFLRGPSTAARVFASIVDGGDAFRARKTNDLPGLDAASDKQIFIRLEEYDAAPLVPLTTPSAAIVSAKGAGCGPFVPLHPMRRQGVTLLAFQDHVRGRPFLDRIRVDAHRDTPALKRAFNGGDVALALGEAGHSTLAGTLMLILDASRPPFRARAFRAAVSSTLDRESLARRFLPGSSPSLALLAPRLLPWHPLQNLDVVPAAARASDSIVLAVSESVPRLASQRVVAHLSALGLAVRVEVVALSAARWPSAHARLSAFIPEVAEPHLALHEMAHLAGAPEAVMALLREARGEIDADRRATILRAAHDDLLRNNTLIPLAVLPESFAASPRLAGLRTDRDGDPVLEDVWITS
ncbi:MAG: ABC transporter substrate-binding protein [Vicinamibacteria bacterium]|nr:ABC transporter substrate-binding protein [Vicinamibacteria bacterium]